MLFYFDGVIVVMIISNKILNLGNIFKAATIGGYDS